MGNGEAKELICITHGHELRGAGNAGGWGSAEWRGNNWEKKILQPICASYPFKRQL